MKKFLLLLILFPFFTYAQIAWTSAPQIEKPNYNSNFSFSNSQKRKLLQRNHGVILGLQRGSVTAFEMGVEAHWRKLAFRKPKIVGATANIGYNFGKHVVGYQAGMWMKTGRINLTYGGNLVYYSNFKSLSRYGIGPAVGFRLAGFHLINGYNFLAGNKELQCANTLYMTLRYYFPLENKFTWDRKTMKKKRERKKEKEKKKKQRKKEKEKKKEDNEEKGLKKLLSF
jgi:hypothetical protein